MGVQKFSVVSLTKANIMNPQEVGYQDSIDIIYDELHKTRKSFIKIGWYLKHINENEMYVEDGYSNIYEFAHDKFHISQSTATRFMNLCVEFSIGHDSPELDEKYLDFSVSQLFEMLPMGDEKEQITSDMTVKEIREAKKESKSFKEPKDAEIKNFYNYYLSDISATDRENLKSYMIACFGKSHAGGSSKSFNYDCSPRGIKINSSDEITWTRFVNRVNELIPVNMDVAESEDDNIPGQTSIEKDFPEYMPESSIKEKSLPDKEYATSHKTEEKAHEVIEAEYKELDVSDELEKVSSDLNVSERDLRDEIEELADGVRVVFWGWNNSDKIPREEVEMAKKNALKLTAAIEKLLMIKESEVK